VGLDIPGDRLLPASIPVGSSTAVAPSPEAVKDLCCLTSCRKKAINGGQGSCQEMTRKGARTIDWKWPRQKWIS
jgi:hypothetical protein